MSSKIKTLHIISILFVFFNLSAEAQEIKLKGRVLYDTQPLKDINILNKTTQKGTATNEEGVFVLEVSKGDSILFSSLSFSNRIIKVSETHIEEKTMEVYLELGFTQLDEVELEQWFRMELGDIAVDERTRLSNDQTDLNRPPNASYFVDPTAKHQGISARSIYRAITKKSRLEKAELQKLDEKMALLKEQFPEELKESYGVDFFTISLKIPEDEVDRFLNFCDDNGLGELFDKSAFEITDFLIKQSTSYNLAKN